MQIREYLTAERSLLAQGPVPLTVYQQRVQQCRHRAIDPDDGRAYCTQCSCGSRDRAKLDVKMHMPTINCDACGITPAAGEGRASLQRIGGFWRQVRAIAKMAAKSHGLRMRDVLAALRQAS